MEVIYKLCCLNNLKEYLKRKPGLLSPSAVTSGVLLIISTPKVEHKSAHF